MLDSFKSTHSDPVQDSTQTTLLSITLRFGTYSKRLWFGVLPDDIHAFRAMLVALNPIGNSSVHWKEFYSRVLDHCVQSGFVPVDL